ncbi:MAG: hypothetical protein QOK23_4535 [Gammaproteobacteria bacterium]|nr:hypothetical protein [Gammaproteobacteria bacterium]
MTDKPATMQRLKAAAAKAAARAAGAKEQVRSAKALLKQARKAFKAEKKAAKQARRKLDAAAAVRVQDGAAKAAVGPKPPVRGAVRTPARGLKRNAVRKAAPGAASPARPVPKTRAPKAGAPKPPDTMRSAAEVAKSVIERLHSPPPVLAPAAVIPSDSPGAREPSPPPLSPSRDAAANPDRDGA